MLAAAPGAGRLHKQLGSFGRQPPVEGGSALLPDPRRKSTSVLEYEWPSVTVSAPVSPPGELTVTAPAGRFHTAAARARQIESTFVVRDEAVLALLFKATLRSCRL